VYIPCEQVTFDFARANHTITPSLTSWYSNIPHCASASRKICAYAQFC